MSGGEGGCGGRVRQRTTRSRMSGKYLPVLVERKETVVSESVTKRHLGKHYFCIRIRISNHIELALHE